MPIELLVASVIRELSANGYDADYPRQVVQEQSGGLVPYVRGDERNGVSRFASAVSDMGVTRHCVQRILWLNVLRSHFSHERRANEDEMTFTIEGLATRIVSRLVQYARTRQDQVSSVGLRCVDSRLFRSNDLVGGQASRVVWCVVWLK